MKKRVKGQAIREVTGNEKQWDESNGDTSNKARLGCRFTV